MRLQTETELNCSVTGKKGNHFTFWSLKYGLRPYFYHSKLALSQKAKSPNVARNTYERTLAVFIGPPLDGAATLEKV